MKDEAVQSSPTLKKQKTKPSESPIQQELNQYVVPPFPGSPERKDKPDAKKNGARASQDSDHQLVFHDFDYVGYDQSNEVNKEYKKVMDSVNRMQSK